MKKKYLWACCAYLLTFVLSQPALSLTTMSGDLESFLKSIDYGDKDANNWVEPDAIKLDQYRTAVDYFLSNDFLTAHQVATAIGYEVIEFTVGKGKKTNTHYILWETEQLPSTAFTGGGTLVMNPEGANVVLQAPHPNSDLHTEDQAIETYLGTNTKYLMLAGTRRENSTQPSPCTDASYRKSDSAHYTEQFFYAAHERISLFNPSTIFIQLHGFGTSSLNNLQVQCGTSSDLLANISDGVNHPSDPNGNDFMHELRRNIENGGIIDACVYGNDTSSLGGAWNTTGRFTNDSVDACTLNADQPSHRFIHLEQSYNIRAHHRDDMKNYISAAVNEYFNGGGSNGGGNGGGKGRNK